MSEFRTYPMSLSQVDKIYLDMAVNGADFFGNMLRAQQTTRSQWNKQLSQIGEDSTEWQTVYGDEMEVIWNKNQIAVPSGDYEFFKHSFKALVRFMLSFRQTFFSFHDI